MRIADAAAAATFMVATLGILGLFYKFVLLPNLREQLFKPIQETNKAVTQNGNRNEPATVIDRQHTLQESVDDLHMTVKALVADVAEAREAAQAAVNAATSAATEATKQRKQIDLAQTVLLEHISGHTHDDD